MTTAVPTDVIRDLGRTGGDDRTLGLLVRGQRTRRLLLLRALLDAVVAAPPTTLPPPAAHRARAHWRLLETADRTDPQAVRDVLYYPLVGSWAESCLRALDGGEPGAVRALARDLGHLGALACAGAAGADLTFTARVPLHEGRAVLPTLGAAHFGMPRAGAAEVRGTPGRLRLQVTGRPPVELRRDAEGRWRAAGGDPRWSAPQVLLGGRQPVLIDDLDPFRGVGGQAALVLGPDERDRWREHWAEALPLLRLGRDGEVGTALLDCFVPIVRPAAGHPDGPVSSSGTRAGAFGAVLASPPPGPDHLAATLVHELHHARLAALSDLVPLHNADPQQRYWAPWRPDARPFGGLLQGTYAHLALAAHWQCVALHHTDPVHRDRAWAEHARCREQVGAALPALLGSHRLTPPGRIFVMEMAALHDRLRDHPPPEGHRARATAYVETTRLMWRQRRPR